MPRTRPSLALLLIAAAGCGPSADGGPLGYEPELLEAYRSALPKKDALVAPEPQASGGARATGVPAQYPMHARPIAHGINHAVTSMVDLLERIVLLPPSFYNSETREFVWGPYDNNDDFGKVAAYIRENPPGDDQQPPDFKYSYALLRGVGNDVATYAPVIWGGANPNADDPDHGSGITLWDFEANHAFAEAHDPDYAQKTLARGRFVALYGRGPAEDNPDATFAFVVAVFRNFVPEDKPAQPPVDLDYLFGRYQPPAGLALSFLDFALQGDINDTPESLEDLSVRMAFVSAGQGRAEVGASGGSLAAGQTVSGIECWDTALQQTYFKLELDDNGSVTVLHDAGAPISACGAFEPDLDALGVPSLATLQAEHPELLTKMAYVAEHGIAGAQ